MRNEVKFQLETVIRQIYEACYDDSYMHLLNQYIEKWDTLVFPKIAELDEKNIYLITYGDSIYTNQEKPLLTLHQFLQKYVKETISDVHLLPMFPWTSDDGFSVKDYLAINPEYGDWDAISLLASDQRLMFDFVANHISKESAWFQWFCENKEPYTKYFIRYDETFDYSQVVRPRTTPLFHTYQTKVGKQKVWTTFSEDQIDLNYEYFPLLMEMSDILMTYIKKGATSIRLDAIGFLWRQSKTSCMHLKQTHQIIQFWHLLLSYYAPNVQIITETNVPHHENIQYFGDNNEASMIYQFALPPLVLHTLTVHDASRLSKWASSIQKVSDQATYFNFLSSHDGIGIRPVEGILTAAEIQVLVDKTIQNKGRVSYKTNADQSTSVYELNINYHDALINAEDDTNQLQVAKILAANAILLSVLGVPAIYYHSLLGSRNDIVGVEVSKINRRINRQKLEYNELCVELEKDERRKAIFQGIQNLIKIRKQESAFSPYAQQAVLDYGNSFFVLKRYNEKTKQQVLLLLNVTNKVQTIEIPTGINLLTEEKINKVHTFKAYEFIWLKQY